ncbi:MAG: metalloregulator ArsR/SmtB family transcription factor [Nitrososphaerota archaeon]|nr:metalloregulator ArsR/SmtB family transcription factor [Candidatus Bathyarchaeota archaeon]MDW8193918.1 metalloregulator ArsR/SmtB family transcription factor [Nitrososphaerota archaeon]
MSKLKIDERLMRLTISGLCPGGDVTKYAAELRQLADTVARAEEAERRSRIFKALADPTRLRILMLLGIREMCVCEVMIALGLTQPTASHHLGILENAGLVKSRKEGKWVFYKIANPKLIENMRELGVT